MTPQHQARHDALTATIVLAILGLCALLARGAYGQPRNALDDLELAVFRVSIHEGAFDNVHDTALIWQITSHHGDTAAKRLAWLRAHSPRASGGAAGRRSHYSSENGRIGGGWAARLSGACEAPEAFDRAWWNAARKDRCRQIWHFTQALVEGRVKLDPCEPLNGKQPQTWGSPVLDHDRAVRLGMRQHVCHGTINEGWSWP